jgi:hypothetical protein
MAFPPMRLPYPSSAVTTVTDNLSGTHFMSEASFLAPSLGIYKSRFFMLFSLDVKSEGNAICLFQKPECTAQLS